MEGFSLSFIEVWLTKLHILVVRDFLRCAAG